MRMSKLTMLGAAVAMTVVPSLARADDTAQLRAELDAMKAELAQLRNEESENWLNERRAEEVKALVHETLADAETRATLLQDGVMAGYDGKKFFMQSADGSFRLNVEGQIQFRYVYNHTRDDAVNDRENNQGFELRRVKVKFNGHIGDPKIKYKITLATNRTSGSVYLEEAKVSYDVMDWLTVYAGRTKAPFAREELVSSSRQLAVDRSYVLEQFTWGFTEGIGVEAQPIEPLTLNLMFTDGYKSGENDDMSFDADENAHWAVAARAEYLVFGDWKAFKGFNGWQSDETSLMLGGAVAYAAEMPIDELPYTSSLPTGIPADSLSFTVDGSFKSHGWTVFGAGFARYDMYYNTGDPDNAEGTIESYGAMAQVGYNINDMIEPFGRYEFIADGAHSPGEDTDGHIVTAGVNWFLKKNDAKFTTDVMYIFQPTDEMGGSSSGLGIVGSEDGDQVVFRAQFQLLF